MALYDLNDEQAKFLQELVSKVSFSGNLDQLEKSVAMGKSVLKILLNPARTTGKAETLREACEKQRITK